MFKNRIVTALAFVAATLSLANPAMAKKNPDKLGKGEIFVLAWPGNSPHTVGDSPAVYTTTEFDRLQYYNDYCYQTVDKMAPSLLKVVALTVLRNAPGTALGTAFGAWTGGFTNLVVTAKNYGEYGGLAAVGGSIGSGITSWEYGKHYLHAMCMQEMSNMARNKGLLSKDVRIILNPFPANGKAPRRPSGAATPNVDLTSASAPEQQGNDTNNDSNTSTMPPH